MQLLPDDFDALLKQAVQVFWRSRSTGSKTHAGNRGHVIAGKNLDGFLHVVTAVAHHCGISDESVVTTGRNDLTLPGYYRATKSWDVVIVHHLRLVAVLEFKSQVGSFGNNFNNRSEEVIGSAADLWMAAKQGAYHPSHHRDHEGHIKPDPRPPFLGYLMVLEDCDKSTRPVSAYTGHYDALPEFQGASYAHRYRILCERLMEQNLYAAASLMLSPQQNGASGKWHNLTDATGPKNLFTQLAAHLLAAAQS